MLNIIIIEMNSESPFKSDMNFFKKGSMQC